MEKINSSELKMKLKDELFKRKVKETFSKAVHWIADNKELVIEAGRYNEKESYQSILDDMGLLK